MHAYGRGMTLASLASSPSRDPRALLPALWLFAMLNYVYGDILTLMDPQVLRQFIAGDVDGLVVDRAFLLGAAFLMEVPIAMTLLARFLPDRANRWANIGAGTFKTVVVIASLFVGSPAAYYGVFSAFELVTTVAIVVIAWRWRPARAH